MYRLELEEGGNMEMETYRSGGKGKRRKVLFFSKVDWQICHIRSEESLSLSRFVTVGFSFY